MIKLNGSMWYVFQYWYTKDPIKKNDVNSKTWLLLYYVYGM
jgi:hypothetical protein